MKKHTTILLAAFIVLIAFAADTASAADNASSNNSTYNVVYENYKCESWSDEQYPLIDLFGDKYVPLFNDIENIRNSYVNKLARLVLDSNETYTLEPKEKLDLGYGYVLEAKKIDIDNETVWIGLTRDGQCVAEKNFSVNTDEDNKTWNITLDNIQGENNIVVMKVHVKQLFVGTEKSIVWIDGIWLIDYADAKTLANPTSGNPNLNVTSLDKILNLEKGVVTTSTAWSPDGRYLLITCSKWVPPSKNIVKHYLLDMNSHTFGEINYGISESDTNGILGAKWIPSEDKIYFGVSRVDRTSSGYCFVICNPDGTNLKCVGTNYTDLSTVMKNIGDIGFQRNLNWNPDFSKIVFEWQKPGDASTGVYIADRNGTNTRELSSATYPQPVWYDSDKIFIVMDDGNVELINENGDLVQTFQPENKDEKYWEFSLSPDRKKILLVSGLPGSFDLQTYISNTDGSNLKGNVSYYDGTDERILTKEYWQPDGSLLLVNQNGNLYLVEGDENKKSLLYKGNASEPQWFTDGKKILFVEDKNKLYSIDVNGTDLTFITSLGLTSSYFWDLFWDPLDKAKQFSISPSGNVIVFTSALYPDTGKIIENEPGPSKCQNIAASLFIVNSNGSNLTQITPTIKGRHDILREWGPNGERLTIGSIIFSSDSSWDYKENSLVELSATNSCSIWKNMPVKEIIGGEDVNSVDKVKNIKSSSINTSQVTEYKEKARSFLAFFLHFFTCTE